MNAFLEYTLLVLGDYTSKVHNLISFVIFTIVIIILLQFIKRLIKRSKTFDIAKKYSIYKVLQYIIVSISFVIGLEILGFNITLLLAGSAALLVGLGFGLQHIFNDFLSGVILFLDGTIKKADIIEVNGNIYKVDVISFRTTTAIGRDDEFVILPNSQLTTNTIVNWTHSKVSSRFKITVGVDYSSDVNLVMEILKEATKINLKVLTSPEPFVRFQDYGDSALIFVVFFYTEEIFRAEQIKGEIRIEIFKTLKENNINIPFPQRVIHQVYK